MIAILKRIVVIGLLFGIFYFVSLIQVETTAIVNPKSLAVLGFVILAAFSLGEIFSFFKLPKVIGYLLIGIMFGPYSDWLFNTQVLKVFNFDVVRDLSLVNNVTLSFIALIAGMELNLKKIRRSLKSISLIIFFQIVFIFLMIPVIVFLSAQYIPFLAGSNWQMILAAGLVLSVVAMGTSIELTLVVSDEMQQKTKLSDLILSTAVVKDIIIIILLSIVLVISNSLITPGGNFSWTTFSYLVQELLFSVLSGIVFGILVILYLKYLRKELLIFILGIVIIGSELAVFLNLEILIFFVAAGFVIENFSQFSDSLNRPLTKLTLPVFITFFAIAGASLNLVSITDALLFGLLLVVFRMVALFLSVRLASGIAKDSTEIKKYGWLGFISIGGLILGLSVIIEERLPGIGGNLKNIILSLVGVNIFIGPILYRIGLSKAAKLLSPIKEEKVIPKKKNKSELKLPAEIRTKFNEPDFYDEILNKSVINILNQINTILQRFERKIIYERNEESLELIIHVTEKYSEEYQNLKNVITKPDISTNEIVNEILKTKRDLAGWFFNIAEERKLIEKKIADLEPYVNELYAAFSDITDGLALFLTVGIEPEKYISQTEDSVYIKIRKLLYRLKLKFFSFFNSNYKLKRKIHYRNLAKYFLVGKSAAELLQAVNLVGNERLITLRKIRALFLDMNAYFDELIETAAEEKDSIALNVILLEKFEQIHKQFVNEININTTEINRTGDEIRDRLQYALASPFNEFIEKLKIAGTYEFSERKYKFSKIFKKSEEDKNLALQTVKYWINYYLGFLGVSQKEALITRINVDITSIVQESLIRISEQINTHLRHISLLLKSALVSFNKELKNDKIEIADLRNILISIEEKIKEGILRKHLEELESERKSKKLNLILDELLFQFVNLSESIPEKIFLLEERVLNVERIPKFTELKSIQMRNLSKSILEKKLPRELGEINEVLLNHLNFTITELKNINAIVNYHLSSAQKELANTKQIGKKAALDLSRDLIDRLNNRIENLNQQVNRLEDNIKKRISEIIKNIVHEIDENILHGSPQSISLYLLKEDKKVFVLKTSKNLIEKLSDLSRKVVIMTKRRSIQALRYFFKDLFIKLKIAKYSPLTIGESTTEYELDENKLRNLPFIYRKLFDGSPIESIDFFVKREEIYNTVNKTIDDFKSGKPSSTILIGDPGSGKSSILNTIYVRFLSDYEYLRYSFNETICSTKQLFNILSELLGFNTQLTLEELKVNLNDRTQKRVIILEDIHKLFLKVIGGYESLESLLKLISLTHKNTLWICSINTHAWNLLDVNFNLSNMFQYKINTENLTQKDIRSIIMYRHAATGFDLKFLPADYQRNLYRKDSVKEQEFLKNEYFKKLREYSEGHILSAMYYWLKSIRSVEGNLILMNPIKKINLEILNQLDINSALTIANILQHGWLTLDEHSKIFKLNKDESLELLLNLTNTNLIYQDQIEIESRKYFINKFLYKQIEKELVKRNIL